ncbi:MAG: UDP-N-acetylenolpyruvoylglucosamine reductase, partial [Methylophilaceae bacterium]
MEVTKSKLLKNEPLARYTSWRVGGRADRVFIPANLDDLVTFMKSLDHAEPIFFIGLGSNLLVRDGGVHGTVIVMHQA